MPPVPRPHLASAANHRAELRRGVGLTRSTTAAAPERAAFTKSQA